MKRLNITLPEEIVKELHNYRNISRFIAEALKEKIEMLKREEIDKLLIEAYQDERERKESIKINKEWEAATLEGWD